MKRVLSIILTAVMLLGSLSVLAAVPAVAAETKVVLVPEKPTGAGTEADPYLISKPEHFYWIQQNTNDPWGKDANNNQFATWTAETCGPSFEGVYFKQIADIDFAGYSFKEKSVGSICQGNPYQYNASGTTRDFMYPIGHYTTDTRLGKDNSKTDDKMWGGFAGNYDGQGYSIKNLEVQAHSGGTNERWCVGLFGVIYGATLKNIVLDNVDVVSKNHNVAGILVGKVYAPVYNNNTEKTVHTDAYKNDFNVIENVLIKDTCSLTATRTVKNKEDGSKITEKTTFNEGQYSGSIAGYAVGVTIKNCYNQADINVSYSSIGTGGMVGILGNSTLIDGCINEGDINFSNLEGVTVNSGDEKAFGGIVGFISAGVTADATMNVAKTGFTIQNCINKGGFNYDISAADVKTEYWGGIFGGCQGLVYLGENSTYKYLVKNSHNIATPSNSGIQRFAGIAGCVFISNNNPASPLYVEDCYSVAVDVTHYYKETNEVMSPTDRQTAAGERPVIFVGANKYSYTTNAVIDVTKMDRVKTKATLALAEPINVENEEKTGCVIGTKTFQALINEMTEEVTKNINFDIKPPEEIPEVIVKNKVFAVGGQRYEDGSKYRIILGVNSIDYKKFAVQFVDENWDFVTPETQDAYTSFIETNGTETVTHEASEYGADYLIFFDIPATHYKTTGTCTETINTFAYTKDGTMLKGDKITIIFTDGEVTAAFADTTVGTK